jgi:two-component sensor histidine kinase
VVLAELLQNAVEHAFIEFDEDDADRPDHPGMGPSRVMPTSVGHIAVHLAADGARLSVEVSDDGSGLPEGFDFDVTTSLGLSIVRDLVRTQLDGTIVMRNRHENDAGATGTAVLIELPVREAQRVGS